MTASFRNINVSVFFEKVLEGQQPALVEITAPWCASGVFVEDFLKRLEPHSVRGIKFLRVNAEKAPSLTQELGVTSLPTFLFFEHGALVDSVQGLMTENELSEKLMRLCAEGEHSVHHRQHHE